MNTENFKGLSIEELEERAEFTVVPIELSEYSEEELSQMEADYAAGNYWQNGCKCTC